MRTWLLGISLLALGCGDNSRTCGPGTTVEDGVCVPSLACGAGTIADDETGDCVADGTHVCTNGTRFDPVTGTCQIDPSACQNGTVLIGGACVDPAAGMVVDLEEGPEPNGLGIVEESGGQAGNIILKESEAFVVHGRLEPHDGTPDVDTYVLFTNRPVLLEVSADGVGGVAAGFAVSFRGTPPERFGIDLGSDTSSRQIFLTHGYTYWLSVGDVATMFDLATANAATGPGGSGSYYLSVKPVPLPSPTIVDEVSTTMGTIDTSKIGLVQTTFTTSPHTIALAMPSPFVRAAVLAGNSVNPWIIRASEMGDAPATGTLGGSGTILIAVDNVYSVVPGPVAFTLAIQ